MSNKILYANSMEEYLKAIRDINNNNVSHKLWYRGQKTKSWGLVPGNFREAYSVRDSRGYEISPPKPTNLFSGNGEWVVMPSVREMLKKFKERTSDIDFSRPDNIVQWLELAQHYGLPTYLLDWTTDPLIALFFAIHDLNESDLDQEDCSIVWVINPLEINKITFNESGLTNLLNSTHDLEEIKRQTESLLGTFCFEGRKSHPRICRQSGNFSYTCPGVTNCLNYVEEYQKEIKQIAIPYKHIKNIQLYLRYLDLTKESVYFGESKLDELCREISRKIISEFHDELFKL